MVSTKIKLQQTMRNSVVTIVVVHKLGWRHLEPLGKPLQYVECGEIKDKPSRSGVGNMC
jgi:hypothetical protein